MTDNPRLFYNFTVTLVAGKTHDIGDALSRAPFFSPAELEEDPNDIEEDPRDIEDTIHCLRISSDPALNIISEDAEDNAYAKAEAELLQTGKHATPDKSSPLHEYASSLSTLSISEQEGGTLLIMNDRAKIVVPKPARSKIIAKLHRARHTQQLDSYTTGHI